MLGYYIVSHAGKGLYLTVDAAGTITGRTNVGLGLLSFENVNQMWLLPGSSMTGIEVSSANNPSYMLNARKSTWNCDVYTSNADTVLNFLLAGDGCYKIQLNSDQSRYLTAAGTVSGSNVDWQIATSANANAQLWKLVETSVPEPSGKHILSMPSGWNCNWNQKCSEVTQYFGVSACTLVSGLDAANFYATNGVGYIPVDMDSDVYWSPTSGYQWRMPGPAAFGPIVNKLTEAEFLARIKAEIFSEHPVLIDIGPAAHNHTLFAYGYRNGAASKSDIYVFDPANTKDTSSIYGLDTMLNAAMDWNSSKYDKHNIRNLHTTYRAS